MKIKEQLKAWIESRQQSIQYTAHVEMKDQHS